MILSLNKLAWSSILVSLVIFLAGLLRFSSLKFFHFDHDQQVTAEAAYDFYVNGRITLIGQQLSFPGFFLGPFHNWFQFVPYGICQLRPDCAPLFFIFISIIVLILIYFVISKIFSSKIALTTVVIFGFSFPQVLYEMSINSNYFILLASVLLIFAIDRYFKGDKKYLVIGGFICGFATVNFNPVFILSTLAFYLFVLIKANKKDLPVFLISFFAFSINYTPLFIFNLRHNNILLENSVNFIKQNASTETSFNFLQTINKIVLPFYSNFLFSDINSINLFLKILSMLLIIVGSVLVIKKKEKIYLFFPIWILVVILGFGFYKGHIPDYYFLQILLPAIMLISFVLNTNKYLFIFFAALFLFLNFQARLNSLVFVNYQTKKQIVNSIIKDSGNSSFRVLYEIPMGFNTGYDYLFRLNKKEPQEGGENLYIVGIGEGSYMVKGRYENIFPNKVVQELSIKKNIHLVGIK